MKKVLAGLGAIFLVMILAVGGMFGLAAIRTPGLNAESKTYLEATVPQVLTNPSAQTFLSFVASADKGSIDPAAFPRFASFIFSNLGAFQGCDHIEGGSLQYFSTSGETITASYVANCRFKKASIQATIGLRKRGDAWSLVSLHLDSDTLRAAPAASGTNL